MSRPRGNPQLEHGHTRIANELLEALTAYPFGGGELKTLLAIMRLTYGWSRSRYAIRQTTLAHITQLDRRQVQRVLTGLRRQGVLFCDRTTRPFTYQLNKAYHGWRDWPGKASIQGCELSPEGGKKSAAAPDRSVRPYKAIKIKKKESTFDPAVENVLQRLSRLLSRPLTPDEHQLIARLQELSPTQAQHLLEQAAAASRPLLAHTGGTTDVHQTPHPDG